MSEPAAPSPKGYLRFPKNQRLSYPTLIDVLFAKGESSYAYPLRVTWRLLDRDSIPEEIRGDRLQFMVNIPKKKMRKAVQRVRLRRLVREAWRLQRLPLRTRLEAEAPGKLLHVGVVFVGTEMVGFTKIREKIAKILTLLDKKVFPAPAETKPEAAEAKPEAAEAQPAAGESQSATTSQS